MQGFHVTVGYLPYRYRPEAIGPGYYDMCARRAATEGKPMPEFINGSMVLCSTPSQQLQDYQVIIRETDWQQPWCEWGAEVAIAGPICTASRWLPTQLPPAEDLFWRRHEILQLVRFVAGLFEVPCKLHYYFKNYLGAVDCYVHYQDQMSRKCIFDYYSVLDIWDPSYYNVAKQYHYRGRVEKPHWLVAPRIASL